MFNSRRHQKIIEEAPSLFLDNDIRKNMVTGGCSKRSKLLFSGTVEL